MNQRVLALCLKMTQTGWIRFIWVNFSSSRNSNLVRNPYYDKEDQRIERKVFIKCKGWKALPFVWIRDISLLLLSETDEDERAF